MIFKFSHKSETDIINPSITPETVVPANSKSYNSHFTDRFSGFFSFAGSLSPLTVLFLLILAFICSLTSSATASSDNILYTIKQRGRTIGYSQMETYPASNGKLTVYIEKTYLPYSFFPNTVVREIQYLPEERKIIKYKKTTYYSGGEETIKFSNSDGTPSQLINFGRIFYIDENIPKPGEASFLEECSPALFSIFLRENSFNHETKVKVKYLIPSADARVLDGTLELKNRKFTFSGRFEAITSYNNHIITGIDFPSEMLQYLKTDSIPEMKDVAPLKNHERFYDISVTIKKGDKESKEIIPAGKIEVLAAPPYEVKSPDAARVPLTFRAVDGIMLSGTLTLPRRKGPFPAFVLVAGSGPYDRSGGGIFTILANHLAENGVATFRYDKRGVAESSGDYDLATLDTLVLDADSAVEFLAKQKDINPKQLGIIGHSEGALIAARVTLDNPHVRGVILMASPSVKMFPDMAMEQARYFDNFSHWDRKAAENMQKHIEEVKFLLDTGRMWYHYNGVRIPLSVLASFYTMPDPKTVLRRIGQPVLLLHGANDLTVPVRHSKVLYAEMQQIDKVHGQMRIYENTGHFFGDFIPPADSYPNRTYVKLYDEILKGIMDWVKFYYFSSPPASL